MLYARRFFGRSGWHAGPVPPEPTTVYTDGACLGNPGPGGWAWAVPRGRYRSGPEAWTTNQRMEIRAALDAVTSLDGPVVVVSDSTYVVNCFRDRWWEGWIARGWLNTAKKPVANRDLWEPLIAAHRADPGRVRFQWVKGHSSDVMNDLVDRLAVAAASTQVGREGTGIPDAPGPADVVSARQSSHPIRGAEAKASEAKATEAKATEAKASEAKAAPVPASGSRPAARDPRLPSGHLVLVTGLKPPGLGGYGETTTASRVRTKLAEILAAEAKLHPDLVVVVGLGLGAEQLAAEAAAEAGIPYVVALAFAGVDKVWPDRSRRRFGELTTGARATIILERKLPDSRQAVGAAMARRDAWLSRNVDEAIVVWDGRDPPVGKTVRTLQDHLGEEQVWILEPAQA